MSEILQFFFLDMLPNTLKYKFYSSPAFVECWSNNYLRSGFKANYYHNLIEIGFIDFHDVFSTDGGLATGSVLSNCCDDTLNLINHNLDTTIVFTDHSLPHRAIMINSSPPTLVFHGFISARHCGPSESASDIPGSNKRCRDEAAKKRGSRQLSFVMCQYLQ